MSRSMEVPGESIHRKDDDLRPREECLCLRLLPRFKVGPCPGPRPTCSNLDSHPPAPQCPTSSLTPQHPEVTWPLTTPPLGRVTKDPGWWVSRGLGPILGQRSEIMALPGPC